MKINRTIIHAAICSLFIPVLLPPLAGAAELNRKLYLIAETIAGTDSQKYPFTTPLAVFPFQVSDNLSRKRVDLAVEEILTGNLLKTARFTMVERGQLESVFKEQRLSLSGAIESVTAIKIGKLSGARLLVLGSISKLRKTYQINVRLVDAESGEILSAQYQEVPEKAFDEDAARFITYVPEVQKIGVYVAAVTAHGRVKKIAQVISNGTSITPTNKPSVMDGYGFGLRYWPTSKWMTDFFFFSQLQDKSDRAFDMGNLAAGTETMLPAGKLFAQNGYRLTLNRVFPSENTNVYFGLGWQKFKMRFSSVAGSWLWDINSGGGATPATKSFEIDMPVARAGFEWRPQRRIGLAIFGSYNPAVKPLKMKVRTWTWAGSVVSEEVVVREVVFPQYSLDATLALYF